MKKIIIAFLAMLLLTGSLFSSEGFDRFDAVGPTYSAVAAPYAPMSARMLGMGSAGIAVPGRSDAFFINPAALGGGHFELSLPYVQFTLYHPYDLIGEDENGKSLLSNILDGLKEEGNDEAMSAAVSDLLGIVKSGYGKLLDLDTGVSFTANGFAFGVFANASLHTFANNGGLDAQLIAETNAVAVLGFGHRFELPMDFSLDVGATVRFNYLGYSEAVGKDTLLDIMGGSSDAESVDIDQVLSGISIMGGWSLPIDLGINLNMPYGFSFGVVARNLNGNYHMAIFDDYDGLLDNPFGNPGENNTVERFSLGSDFSLDTGIAWQWENAWLRPTIAVDIVDWVGMCQEPVGLRTFLTHLNIGAEIRLLSFLDLRAGMSQGYFSLGAGLDLWAIKLDLAYYWKEFGETAGDYGLDGFTVRFNIGFDK